MKEKGSIAYMQSNQKSTSTGVTLAFFKIEYTVAYKGVAYKKIV